MAKRIYINKWIFNNEPIDEIPNDIYCFDYNIDGVIGNKLFWSRNGLKESDWKFFYPTKFIGDKNTCKRLITKFYTFDEFERSKIKPYTNKWVYQNSEIETKDLPIDAIGFMYCITNKQDGLKYIGKKLLTKATSNIVKGKKKKFRIESDWKEYYSSSPYIHELIEEFGENIFKREILIFAKSKGELNYFEEACQYKLGVLESDIWLNSNIRSKIFKKHVMKYDIDLLNQIIDKYKNNKL